MPKRYAREFRRGICERLVAGEKVRKLSEETGVSPATLHLWKRQALIDGHVFAMPRAGHGVPPAVGLRQIWIQAVKQWERTG